jgi:hypothetical protein
MADAPEVGSPHTTRIRRVVTGESVSGESVFLHDDEVTAVVNGANGFAYWRLWGNDGLDVLPIGPDHAWSRTIFPDRPEGQRVHAIEFPAAGSEHAAQGDWPPYGLTPEGRYDDPERPGMHWTDTIDVAVVVEGSIGVEQGDGTVRVLGRGDVLVQNGVLHRWVLQPEPCRVVVVAFGAARPAGA